MLFEGPEETGGSRLSVLSQSQHLCQGGLEVDVQYVSEFTFIFHHLILHLTLL
jgi:hypothetical protein